MHKAPFYHVHLDILDTQAVLSEVDNYFSNTKHHTVFFLNTHCFNLAAKDLQYRSILKKCDLILNDGVGVEIASWLAGNKIKENLNGTDLIPQIIELAVSKDKKLFLLGAQEDVIHEAASCLKKKYPGINIAGISNGYFDDDIEVINKINDSCAEILIVGMGVPLQEKWIIKNFDALKFVKVSVAGGAIFDFLSGRYKRAPLVMRKLRLEWFFRFIQEPKRLLGRYFGGSILFLVNLIKFR